MKVKWNADDMVYNYRRGHEGYVNDNCVTAAKGEMYCIDHLPKLGNNERLCAVKTTPMYSLYAVKGCTLM